MAKNKARGDERRVGAVKERSQIRNPVTGTWTKRDDRTGRFMDVKADQKSTTRNLTRLHQLL